MGFGSPQAVDAVMRWDGAVEAVEAALGIRIRGGVGFAVPPLAWIAFHEHRHPTIECSVYAASPRWARPAVIGRLLRFPFVDLGCKTLLTLIPSRNARSRRFNSGIGFEFVGTISHGADDDDICLYQLTEERAQRWLKRA